MESNHDDNVYFIDEFNRERWLLKLEIARRTGQVAVFNADLGRDADILPFRRREEPTETPEPAA